MPENPNISQSGQPQINLIKAIQDFTRWTWSYQNGAQVHRIQPNEAGLCHGFCSMVIVASAISEDIRRKQKAGQPFNQEADTLENLFKRFDKVLEFKSEEVKTKTQEEQDRIYNEMQLFYLQISQGQKGYIPSLKEDGSDSTQSMMEAINAFRPSSMAQEFEAIALYLTKDVDQIIEWAKLAQPGDSMFVDAPKHIMALYITQNDKGENVVGFYDPNNPRLEVTQNNLRDQDTAAEIKSHFEPFQYFNNHKEITIPCMHVAHNKSGYIEVSNCMSYDLSRFDTGLRKTLIGHKARLFYIGGSSPSELAEMFSKQDKKFSTFFDKSSYAALYCSNGIKFNRLSELYDHKRSQFDLLNTYGAFSAFKDGGASFEDLSRLCETDTEKERFKLLVHDRISLLYAAGVKFSELNKWTNTELTDLLNDSPKLDALISENAKMCYNIGIQISELGKIYDSDKEKFNALMNHENIAHYHNRKLGCPTFDQLKVLTTDEINAIAASSYGILNLSISYNELLEIHRKNPGKLDALFSKDAIKCYMINTNRAPKFEDLKGLDEEKIKALTSPGAQECYKKTANEYPAFNQLKDFSADKINALTSYGARNGCYDNPDNEPRFDQLKHFDADKINALVDSITCFLCDMPLQELESIYKTNKEKLVQLTAVCNEIILSYPTENCNPSQIVDLDTEQIKALIAAKLIYDTTKKDAPLDLNGLSVDQIMDLGKTPQDTRSQKLALHNSINSIISVTRGDFRGHEYSASDFEGLSLVQLIDLQNNIIESKITTEEFVTKLRKYKAESINQQEQKREDDVVTKAGEVLRAAKFTEASQKEDIGTPPIRHPFTPARDQSQKR